MPRSSLLDAPGAGGGGVERSASAETSLVNVSLSSAASGANTSMSGSDTSAGAASEGGGRSDLDPDTSGLTNMLCAWAIGLLSAIEGTISVPSLWQ